MAFNPSRSRVRPLRAHVIRVYDPGGAAQARRFAVLAPDAQEALATMIANLACSEIAEITDEVLDPTAGLGLEPCRPLRLS